MSVLGLVQVRAVFGAGNRVVAGCMVNEGMLRKGCLLVVNRGKKVTIPDHCYCPAVCAGPCYSCWSGCGAIN